MSLCYDSTAPKKAVNLSLNADLLRMGKELGLNVSSLAEEALGRAVKAGLAAAWLRENGPAIQGYNERVARDGVFSDQVRRF